VEENTRKMNLASNRIENVPDRSVAGKAAWHTSGGGGEGPNIAVCEESSQFRKERATWQATRQPRTSPRIPAT